VALVDAADLKSKTRFAEDCAPVAPLRQLSLQPTRKEAASRRAEAETRAQAGDSRAPELGLRRQDEAASKATR
jgi:hypothetical protein